VQCEGRNFLFQLLFFPYFFNFVLPAMIFGDIIVQIKTQTLIIYIKVYSSFSDPTIVKHPSRLRASKSSSYGG